METPIVIEGRFNGPEGSGNGGYTCGLVAARVDSAAVEVTLRRPPPLDRPLTVRREDDGVVVLDGDDVVAEGRAGETVDADVPAAVSREEAERAAAGFTGFTRHHFPTCFVCGPARAAGDGLRIFAGPVAGRDDGVVAAPWTPIDVRPEVVWASLDCPGAFAVGWAERGETVLGRMAAEVRAVPAVGEHCVVMAWPLGDDGRKLYAGTALLGEDGRLLGRARQTWIVPR
jgi:hypothetical protein